MPTLLLSARQTDDAQSLWRACITLKWDVVRVHGWRVPAIASKDVAVYGEPLFAHHVAQALDLQLQEPPLDWLPRLAPNWRGRHVRLTTLAAARNFSSSAFIKPADDKCFDAKVYSSGAELPAAGLLPEDLAVLVQEIVEWTIEYRCFILNRNVVTLSPYWRNGRLAKSDDGMWPAADEELNAAKDFCQRLLADDSVEIPKAVVIDVGVIANHGWAVVESNAAFSSGMYGCDAEKVLPLLLQACRPN
ncbi:MAG: ATP-grasp domain-containing protein [Verrucomicrobiota bacterium]